MHHSSPGDLSRKRILATVVKKHKIAVSLLAVGLVASGYFAYKGANAESAETTYRTAAAERGQVIVPVSGSGQVSASSQVDLKPKVSGNLTGAYVKNGQQVTVGTALFQIDARNAQKDVRDARTSLETAQLELEKLLAPVDELTLLSTQNNLAGSREDFEKLKRTQETDYQDTLKDKQDAEDALGTAYENAFNDISDAFLDMPDVITALYDALYDQTIAESESVLYNFWSNIIALKSSIDAKDMSEQYAFDVFSSSAEESYTAARTSYDANFDRYKSASRYSPDQDIEALLDETMETTRKLSEAVKNATNMFEYWADYRSLKQRSVYSSVASYRTTLSSLTGTVNSHLSSLLSARGNVKKSIDAIASATESLRQMDINNSVAIAASERNLVELEKKLIDLESPPDELDIRARRIAVQQAQDKLTTAQQDLADHTVRAPFEGLIASTGVSVGESVSSGTTLATLITAARIAEIVLNEVDISKVTAGQKAAITFDAIDDLSVTGEVASVDTLSTTSQGVVTYDVTVVFDVQDERVRPGMSVSVDIITDRAIGVLVAPNAAVKSQGGVSYVEIMQSDGTLRRQTVETGLSGDTVTEIASGVSEGDLMVTQTIAPTNGSSAAPATNSILPTGGGRSFGGGGGGQVFIGR